VAERRRSSSQNGRVSGRDAIERVRQELPELLGRQIETVVGFERDEENGWKVTVEVVELERIPHTTDILGRYEATLDTKGELAGYRRTRRYHRNQSEEE
jgi:hypothetical protein